MEDLPTLSELSNDTIEKFKEEAVKQPISLNDIANNNIEDKNYECTLTGHKANTKAAIYKYRNYCKKNGTLPDGKGKIVFIGKKEPPAPRPEPTINLVINDDKEPEPEIVNPLYSKENGEKEAMYSHLKMLEHEAKDHLDGYKVKATPESSLEVIKEETRFIVSILQNKGLSKTAYQMLLTMSGFMEQISQHERVNPYVDLSGYSKAIESEEKDIQECLARCIREAPVEFQQMLTPQSHLMIIMTSLAVKVNADNQDRKRRSFLEETNVPRPSIKK